MCGRAHASAPSPAPLLHNPFGGTVAQRGHNMPNKRIRREVTSQWRNDRVTASRGRGVTEPDNAQRLTNRRINPGLNEKWSRDDSEYAIRLATTIDDLRLTTLSVISIGILIVITPM